MENRYNLVDEPWIPISGVGRVSLRRVFTDPTLRSLGGNPVQKIAVMKLLLAIAQAAATPDDDDVWRKKGFAGLGEQCSEYLTTWHDHFYLFGDRPFLQLREIEAAAIQSYGAVLPEISTGNTTVLTHSQCERALADSEKALLLVTLMSFALSGKKTDNSVILTPNYQGKLNEKGKPSSSKPGPGVAHLGLLHSFLLGSSVVESVWLNVLSHKQIEEMKIFPDGVGIPPWQEMPAGEDCPVARRLRSSLIGRLVPMCRFCLLTETGLHYSEGILHPNYKEGIVDPTVAVNYAGKDPKALWVDPEKRPWRELPALLSFIEKSDGEGFKCWQINCSLDRARDVTDIFAIWSGGLRVSSNAGEQYVSGSDDFVESLVWLESKELGALWLAQLKQEMDALSTLSKMVYRAVIAFYKAQMVDGAELAAQSSNLFWILTERNFQKLVNSCGSDEESASMRKMLRQRFVGYVHYVYDRFCPKETGRQLDAWAQCRPITFKYLIQEA